MINFLVNKLRENAVYFDQLYFFLTQYLGIKSIDIDGTNIEN